MSSLTISGNFRFVTYLQSCPEGGGGEGGRHAELTTFRMVSVQRTRNDSAYGQYLQEGTASPPQTYIKSVPPQPTLGEDLLSGEKNEGGFTLAWIVQPC